MFNKTNNFYVEGNLLKDVCITYHTNNSLNCINFPLKPLDNVVDDSIKNLINTCNPACYGHGNKLCCDETVRKAYCMKKDEFNTNLDIHAQSLLKCISETLITENDLICSRDKLNIYTKGGHFKTHKDTLVNDKMIGSLVICLPSYFEGGELVLEKNKDIVTCNWSDKSKEEIQWVAFFSDINHKVCEVTKGERITVTYNILISDDMRNNISYVSKSNEIIELMKNTPRRSIGYFCKYMYGGKTTDFKNEDLIFYKSAIASGYEVKVEEVITHAFGENSGDQEYFFEECCIVEFDKLMKEIIIELKNFEGFCKLDKSNELLEYLNNIHLQAFDNFDDVYEIMNDLILLIKSIKIDDLNFIIKLRIESDLEVKKMVKFKIESYKSIQLKYDNKFEEKYSSEDSEDYEYNNKLIEFKDLFDRIIELSHSKYRQYFFDDMVGVYIKCSDGINRYDSDDSDNSDIVDEITIHEYLKNNHELLTNIKWTNNDHGVEGLLYEKFLYGNDPASVESFYRNICIIVEKSNKT
jgi:hypothetical protein